MFSVTCGRYPDHRLNRNVGQARILINLNQKMASNDIIDILHIFELESILYKAGIPDFSVCAKVTVSIENMNEIRRENFRKCDIKCA